jgi:hypothetical protein
MRMLRNYKDMFNPVPKSILYAYGEYSETVPKLRSLGVSVMAGTPTDEQLAKYPKPLLLVMDDLMLATSKKYLEDMFTKKSHHQNIAVVFVTQNLFDKNLVAARQNAHYLVLMRAPNSAMHIKTLAIQMFADKFREFLKAYEEATRSAYGYLLVDLHPSSHPELRLRTSIFPDDHHVIFT